MTPHPVTRRTLLRGALVGAATGALAGCTSSGSSQRTTAAASSPAATTAGNPTPMPSATNSSTLLAYFSRPGENYWNGGRRDLDVGNTEVLTTMISGLITCDVYRIEAAEPYSDDYDDTVARNVRERDDDARPAIAAALPSLDAYDTVLIGSPIWNVRPPMIMSTFVEGVDLTAKRLLPFVTHAVSGLGSTVDDYTALVPDATIGKGLAVRGEQVAAGRPEVERWLRAARLLT